jgi:hypothetical protein
MPERDDDPELSADQVEELLIRFGEAKLPEGTEIDPDRLHETLRNAIGAHPDRDLIVKQLRTGSKLFPVFPVPHGDEFKLRLGRPGYDPTPTELVPPCDEFYERTIELGRIPMAQVQRRPQG